MTKLEAINLMLTAIQMFPIPSLIIKDKPQEAELAELLLDISTNTVLTRGFSFNTEKRTLQRDAMNEIPYPVDALKIDAIDGSSLTRKKNKLYNLDTNSYMWNRDVEAYVTVLLDFEDIPIIAQEVILSHSIREFQARILGQSDKDTLMKISEAEVRLKVYESEVGNYNMFQNPEINYNINRRRYL